MSIVPRLPYSSTGVAYIRDQHMAAESEEDLGFVAKLNVKSPQSGCAWNADSAVHTAYGSWPRRPAFSEQQSVRVGSSGQPTQSGSEEKSSFILRRLRASRAHLLSICCGSPEWHCTATSTFAGSCPCHSARNVTRSRRAYAKESRHSCSRSR